jgi:hypothetical protein
LSGCVCAIAGIAIAEAKARTATWLGNSKRALIWFFIFSLTPDLRLPRSSCGEQVVLLALSYCMRDAKSISYASETNKPFILFNLRVPRLVPGPDLPRLLGVTRK